MKGSYPYFLCILLLPLLFSCLSSRKSIYFNINGDAVTDIQNPMTEPVIQKNDLLSITVSSKSPEASQIYNMPAANRNVTGTELNGYLVNDDSTIQFPVLGAIKAAGRTKTDLQRDIVQRLQENKLLLDPIVSIRNLNFKVTVLGEVLHPSVVNVPAERINLLEALGFAGDLTLYANRTNVLLIREVNNKRVFKTINLNSNEIFSSEYFNLKPNDIVYVQPNKTKIAGTGIARQWLPVLFSAISLATITIYRLK